MSPAVSGRSTTYWPARRRNIARRSKAAPFALSAVTRSSRLNAGDAGHAGFLPEGDVVAPQGQRVLLGEGDDARRDVAWRAGVPCVHGGREGFEHLGLAEQQGGQ